MPPAPSLGANACTVGATVSTVKVTVLFASAPSTLKFPAASENLLLATEMTAFDVLFVLGVNVAE